MSKASARQLALFAFAACIAVAFATSSGYALAQGASSIDEAQDASNCVVDGISNYVFVETNLLANEVDTIRESSINQAADEVTTASEVTADSEATTDSDPLASTVTAADQAGKASEESTRILADAIRAVSNTTSATSAIDVPSASEQGEDTDPTAKLARSLTFKGVTIPYTISYRTSTAPSSGAGLWMGDDDATDGTWGYFIGHNPGDFSPVMSLALGDEVTLCDSKGIERTYHVVDAFTVSDSTYWEDIENRVTHYGESIVLQTCSGDNATYRIVVAA